MSSSFGNCLKLTIFGESHGPAVGVTVEGLPAGLEIDWDLVRREMARRAPGQGQLTTPRKEADEFEILSGLYQGRLTGTPVTAIIRNTNQRSSDYGQAAGLARPGHADFTGHVRYRGYEDPRGGGHFSGRLTAGLVFAGALTRQWLQGHKVQIAARVVRVGAVTGDGFSEAMEKEILAARAANDSVGGVIECAVTGLPAGLGAPFFDSAESVIAHLLFSIPAIKGVEFGDGFDLAARRGSEVNDSMAMKDGRVAHLSNHAGGVLGGITNGEALVFRAAIKPTPSIARLQQTVSLETGEDAALEICGRHDPCIVPRALPVIEAAAALAVGELWKEKETWRD